MAENFKILKKELGLQFDVFPRVLGKMKIKKKISRQIIIKLQTIKIKENNSKAARCLTK